MEIFTVNPKGSLLVSGDIDDWGLVRERRVEAIVDMDGGVDPGVPQAPNELIYIYFPIIDDRLPDLRKLNVLGRLVADLVRTEQVVLVHCRLGLNRSNLVVGTALTYLGMSGAEAVERLQQLRPGALYNEIFARYLRELPARLVPDRFGLP